MVLPYVIDNQTHRLADVLSGQRLRRPRPLLTRDPDEFEKLSQRTPPIGAVYTELTPNPRHHSP